MSNQNLEILKQKISQLATQSQEQGAPSAWFEILYKEANGDASQIPWAKMTTNPILQHWLNQHNPSGTGKTALVIGCGLGDDAETLAKLGFNVTAFDISPTAIAWCRQRFPDSPVNYLVADLLQLAPSWDGTFDLVVESRTIQALPVNLRQQVIQAIARLVKVQGRLLAIARIRETEELPSEPPWGLSESELAQFREWQLKEVKRQLFAENQGNDPVKQLCLEYLRWGTAFVS